MRYTAIWPSEIRFRSVLGLMFRILAASSTRNRADGSALRRTPPGKALVDSFLAPDSLMPLRECPSSDFDLRPRLFVAASVRLRESAVVIEIPPSKCRRIVRTLSVLLIVQTHSGHTTPTTRLWGREPGEQRSLAFLYVLGGGSPVYPNEPTARSSRSYGPSAGEVTAAGQR
jgi:hypothetical protein